MIKRSTILTAMTLGSWLVMGNQSQAVITHPKAWVDIPSLTEVKHNFSEATWYGEIQASVDHYHSLDKHDIQLLDRRADLLNGLADQLDSIAQQPDAAYVSKNLSRFATQARNKAWYLIQINELYSKYMDNPQKIMAHFMASDVPHENQLTLVNEIFYDFKLPAAWGLYWLETLDPCHRLTLTPYYMQWSKSGTPIPFFLWLEDKNLPYHTTEVDYLAPQEIESLRLTLSPDNQLLQNTKGETADFSDTAIEYLYVLTPSGALYVSPGNDQIRHASISQGKPVVGSGSIKILDGKIEFLDVESGHYQPTPAALMETICMLEASGIQFHDSAQVKYYTSDGLVHECTVTEFQTTWPVSTDPQSSPEPEPSAKVFKL